ncbi:DUF3108 domain-containing protein [bacterium]|nr:MAG: DUF3108 domain-containing protein [bacterium]
MKKNLLILFLVLFTLTLLIRYNNDPKNVILSILKQGNLNAGNLTYRVNFLGIIPVAEATLSQNDEELYKGTKVYHLKATARSLKYLDVIFRGSATIDSYVDTKTLNPIFFKQELLSPGKEKENKEICYDQDNNTMTRDGVSRLILPNTQDPLSLIYNIRKINFDKIKEVEYNINTNQKNYIFKAKAKIKDITVHNKSYKIVLLKGDIRRRDKSPYHQTKISMIILKEAGNLPVLINVLASGVPINVRLSGIK